MKEWKRLEPTEVTKVGYRTIVSKTFETPDGKVGTFDTMWPDGQEFACGIMITPEKKVVVARQFRIGPEKMMDELPGGGLEKGEAPEDGFRREAREETGYEPGEVTYLGAFHKDAYLNAVWHAFFATNCVRVTNEQELDEDEHVEIDVISIGQLLENAVTDRMTDVAPVFMVQDRLKELMND